MKCKICRQPTDEFLVTESVPTRILFFTWNGAKVEKLCREHLIQRFREEFTRATHRMVVFHPNLEEKHGDYQYSYVRWNRIMKGLGGDPDVNARIIELANDWFSQITGTCNRCSHEAQIAYFDRKSISWEKVPVILGVRYDFPMIHKVTADPEKLCRNCAFDSIEKSLRTSVPGFENGVLSPMGNEEGIYITLEM